MFTPVNLGLHNPSIVELLSAYVQLSLFISIFFLLRVTKIFLSPFLITVNFTMSPLKFQLSLVSITHHHFPLLSNLRVSLSLSHFPPSTFSLSADSLPPPPSPHLPSPSCYPRPFQNTTRCPSRCGNVFWSCQNPTKGQGRLREQQTRAGRMPMWCPS